MNLPFMAALMAYLVIALTLNLRCKGARNRTVTFLTSAMQGLLFAYACYFAVQRGVFTRQLVSPVAVGSGLLAGHLIFGASLLISDRSLRDAFLHFTDLAALWDYAMESPRVLTRFLAVAVSEELVYRVGAQTIAIELTGRPVLSVLGVAVVFSVVHKHFFENSFWVSTEFLLFAVLLGGLYFWTGSLVLVVVVHAVRNIEISFLEEVIQASGEADRAGAGSSPAAPPCPQAMVS